MKREGAIISVCQNNIPDYVSQTHTLPGEIYRSLLFLIAFFFSSIFSYSQGSDKIDLSGEWHFKIDFLDKGMEQEWFNKKLDDSIQLPGSMTTNGKGNDIDVNTPWTGDIADSSWFFKPEYAQFRQPGNIKVPFWLQPVKYYKGPAWFQKTVTIPASWKNKHLELFIERSHWETTAWVDDTKVGMQNSLATAQVFDLTKVLTPGTHRLTVRIDNRIKEINVGSSSHSVSDHTQTNWNGMIGQLYLSAQPAVYIDDVQLYPDIKNKQVTVKVLIRNITGKTVHCAVQIIVISNNPKSRRLKLQNQELEVSKDSIPFETVYPMGEDLLLWDEFHPNLYSLSINLTDDQKNTFKKNISFGMRQFSEKGTQFTINGRPVFLRGTLECAIFPLTGYPATNVNAWMRIFKMARSYGLNHMRFHSWCPPEAAFKAADQSGFYLQIECSSWANMGASIGDGLPLDQYIYDESNRIVKAYGNHPSFCMLAYGNEPAGEHLEEYLKNFVNYWKDKDSRRLYTSAAGWPVIKDNDYNSSADPRIQQWGDGLKSIINSKPPAFDYDWSGIIAKWQHPTVSHEIGQWCVYPDFKEIKKYTGVLKAKNFEIFQYKLNEHGMAHLADSFLLASGKLQALCYKADIEAAMRTPGFGGFQLLDIHDFPGQGTALVGVLNPFWEDKGYITGKEYSHFCNSTVPLARLSKMIYLNNEQLQASVEIGHFGESELKNVTPSWTIASTGGKILFRGQLQKTNVPVANGFKLGEINQSLGSIKQPSRLVLTVSADVYSNSWNIFVYPSLLPKADKNILVVQQIDNNAMQTLNKGGKVLLTIKKGAVKPEKGGDIAIGFSSIFWNTAWTGRQAPHTLGILCNPKHPALKEFPTEYYSNWQWWDAMSHSNAIILDSVSKNLYPIVRVIDDWVTARPLGLVFECKVGKGKLLVSGIDLLSDQDRRPEARQLLYSLESYMNSNTFNPAVVVDIEKIKALFN